MGQEGTRESRLGLDPREFRHTTGSVLGELHICLRSQRTLLHVIASFWWHLAEGQEEGSALSSHDQ